MKTNSLPKDFPSVEEVVVDCEGGKRQGCRAKCCSFWFGLTPEEVKEGVVKFDPKMPYVILKGDDGYCVHLNRETLKCEIWDKRPQACREYSCINDERVWGEDAKH